MKSKMTYDMILVHLIVVEPNCKQNCQPNNNLLVVAKALVDVAPIVNNVSKGELDAW